jgi:hypothetical protein
MSEARDTVSVDEHAGRHTSNLKSLSEGTLRIEVHNEVGMVSLQESLGIGPVVIEIDSNDTQPLPLVGLFHHLHPRKGLPAGRAP